MMKDLNPLSRDDEHVDSIMGIATAFQKSRVLLTACEIDLFTHLGGNYRSSADLAGEIGADHRALERLMDALCSMDVLVKLDNKFANTPSSQKCLVQGSPYYLGNLRHLNYLWDSWSNLTESVLRGTAYNYESIDHGNPERVGAFIEAMHWRAAIQAPEIVKLIDLSGVNKILDLGSGSGAYAIEFARNAPGAEVFAFDLPNVSRETRKYLDKDTAGRNINIIEGDYTTGPIGKGYDLVFVSSVIHSHSFWENIALAQKIYDSLNRGGRIVIQDFIIESNRCAPPQTVMFSLNMLANTKKGDTFTETEIWFLLREAWFSDINRIDTRFGTSLVTGTR